MVDTLLTGYSWFTLPANTYTERREKKSTCQAEVDVFYTDLVAHDSMSKDGKWGHMAPVRYMSFDIECSGRQVKNENL
jgi:DNA polymerase delta subunit 1